MNLERYSYSTSNDFQRYSFYSEGPKGKIKKTVVYSKIQEGPVIYNLAFGDEDPFTGQINDITITNNEDRDIVLATVANTIHAFIKRHGNHFIFAKGSTRSRTRLYQMSIARLMDEISMDFDVFGVVGNDVSRFKPNVNYDAFLIKRK
ncbi:MAG: DUF6934 family protein [Sphingobacteriales bacterium]